MDESFLKLFIEGLGTQDFEPAFPVAGALVGQRTTLSPSTISCLGQHFKAMYEPFGRQNLAPSRADRLVYIWADGSHCKAGLGAE